jgi:hypothetical protein
MGRWCGGFCLVVLSAVALVSACGGSSSSKDRDDGRKAECEDGDERPDDDGCNSCGCIDGRWACTAIGCPEPCELGEIRDDRCESCICADTGSGPDWLCIQSDCCEPGDMRTLADGCNTCSCNDDGAWECTDRACETCDFLGEVRDAGDGCNTCTCRASGWACTLIDCSDIECDGDHANCDGDATNGCETDIRSSLMNCGRCSNYCALAGAYAACDDGECVIDHCQAGYADCNDEPSDGCEAPVSTSCATRCEPKSGAPGAGPSTGSCECPEGTACVTGSSMNPDGEYCFPLAEGCSSYGSCGCLGACVCPSDPDATCTEQMSLGGMIVHCDGI